MAIKRVWIEEGCIMCNACDAAAPDVFRVTDSTCVIRAEVRVDGQETENRNEKAELTPEARADHSDVIKSAAAGCPVEVIQIEED